ncbi:MAG: hypothetical protein NT132_13285 [Microbacterium sp.]|uniref:hypothetical protein n=1 Tax=Microbacterium sp. TaxID=51671 RepID=UPI002610A9B4|nr:hypothetical protein [Microbacterium sp.]MCX6503350.1 hypothetical protein [Microbacterium sp.]
MNRTLKVVRMQLVNRQTYIWVPLLVLGSAFVITLAIYAILENAGIHEPKYGGGAQAPLWVLIGLGAQALTFTFPFSQAMSVTRREFYLGTLLSAALTSAMLAIIFVVGGFVEQVTGGWGMNGYFFALDWLWAGGPVIAGLFFFVLAMLFFIIGFCAATIFKRFGTLWLTVSILAVAALLVAALWVVGQANAWVQAFTWFAEIGAGGLTALLAAATVVLALVSFPVLRRATP